MTDLYMVAVNEQTLCGSNCSFVSQVPHLYAVYSHYLPSDILLAPNDQQAFQSKPSLVRSLALCKISKVKNTVYKVIIILQHHIECSIEGVRKDFAPSL